MSKSITEILEYLDLGSEKAFYLTKRISLIGLSYLLYINVGGNIIVPAQLNLKVISEYFLTFQFLIPIILYSIVWFIFSIILPIFIRLLLQVLIEWLYFKKVHKPLNNSIEQINALNADEMINGFNRIVKYFGFEKLDKKLIIIFIKNKLETSEIEEEEEIESFDKIDFVIVMIQLLILYLLKIANTLIFNEWFNIVIIIFFALLITFALILNFLQKILERVYSVITQKIKSEIYLQ